MIGFLTVTIAIEVIGFWILFRNRCSPCEQVIKDKEGCSRLYDMVMAILALNFITFLLGGIFYLLLSGM